MALAPGRHDGFAELRAARGGNLGLVMAVAVFSVAVNLLNLTGPLFMMQVYDRVLGSRSVPTLAALFGWDLLARLGAYVGVVVLAPLAEHPGGVLLGAVLGVVPSARALDPPHGLAGGAAGADEGGRCGRGAHGDGLLGGAGGCCFPSTFSCREGTNVPLGSAGRSARDRGIPD